MSKFPVIQQQDSMDCGPVCLAMICKFYGKYYPVSFLHNLCFITTEGVSLYGIALAAESVGFRSFGTMLTIQELAEKTGGCVSDSLEMARFGRDHAASTLVVAGVKFMGETAKILSPEKTILMPRKLIIH